MMDRLEMMTSNSEHTPPGEVFGSMCLSNELAAGGMWAVALTGLAQVVIVSKLGKAGWFSFSAAC